MTESNSDKKIGEKKPGEEENGGEETKKTDDAPGGDKKSVVKKMVTVEDYMKRPARRQSTKVKEFTPIMNGDYNIWYHRYLGYEYHESRKDRGALTRCCVKTDAGRTRADANSPICIHFALGDCVRGHECQYRHCLPTDIDDRRAGITHDVFGRERHKTDREDMGGVGSFSRENRTLYIGGLNADISVEDYEEIVRRHFGEWGDLEYVRTFPSRGFAFVRYRLRTAAEFAKVAMAEQSLDNEETLNIRWANEDPNPIAKAHEEQAATARFLAAVQKNLDEEEESVQPPAAKRPAPTVDTPRSTAKVQYRYVFVGKNKKSEEDGKEGSKPEFSVNPYTQELHPYAQGVYHMNQVADSNRDNSSASNRMRLQEIDSYYGAGTESTESSSTQQQQQQQQQYAVPPPPPPPASDEPGFFNDEPLV